jgi:hypothetical protein
MYFRVYINYLLLVSYLNYKNRRLREVFLIAIPPTIRISRNFLLNDFPFHPIPL